MAITIMTEWNCDRCRVHLSGVGNELPRGWVDVTVADNEVETSSHLCADCAPELAQFMRGLRGKP